MITRTLTCDDCGRPGGSQIDTGDDVSRFNPRLLPLASWSTIDRLNGQAPEQLCPRCARERFQPSTTRVYDFKVVPQ